MIVGEPAELISRIRIPMCFIYGGEDQNVELKTDFVPLQEAIQKSGNKNATVTVLSGLDHFFEEKKGENWWLSDELLRSVSCWLSGHP
jgi:alpha/beta superfamily hydrolase